VDTDVRPSINELLKFPILRHRIRQIMDDDLFFEEFSHTVLHQQQIFQKTTGSHFEGILPPTGEAEQGVEGEGQDYSTPTMD